MPDANIPAILFLSAGNLYKTDSGGLALIGPRHGVLFALSKRESEALSHHLRLISQIWDLFITDNWRHFEYEETSRPYNQIIYRTNTTDFIAELQVFQYDTCLVLTTKSFRHSERMIVLDAEKVLFESFIGSHFPLDIVRLPPIAADRAAAAARVLAARHRQQPNPNR